MLVVISDLHFVDGSAGEHNLPPSAFKRVLLNNVISLARGNKATEVKLLLLGDIPDLIRSQQWFEEAPDDRPWGKNGLCDVPQPQVGSRTEQRCLDILGRFPEDGQRTAVPPGSILYKNWETFAFFREFQERVQEALGTALPVEIIYVVGNHDRLCNLYPSVRDHLKEMLGLTIAPHTVSVDPAGEWYYPYAYLDEAYGVFARHGHQFDPWNYGGGNDFTHHGHLQVSLGDVISTELAVNLPYTFSHLHETHPQYAALVERLKAAGAYEPLLASLKEVDNVRPLSRIIEWFYYRIKQEYSQNVREALDKTFDIAVNDFLQVDFVKRWRSPATHWDELLRLASHPWLRGIVDRVTAHTDTEDLLSVLLPGAEKAAYGDDVVDDFGAAAYRERIWRENPNVRYVLYGHTHRPKLYALDGEGGREVIYLNTGTWRSHIYRTVPMDKAADFIKLKQMTFVTFYNAQEDPGKEPGTVSFDVWTGHKQKYYQA